MYMAIKMKKEDMNLKDIKESYLDFKKKEREEGSNAIIISEKE